MSILEYKCPNCGAGIQFDSAAQKMKCAYCGTEYELETLKAYDEVLNQKGEDDLNWEKYGKESGSGDWQAGEEKDLYTYACEACGGEIIGDATLGATSCPYCGNAVVIPKQFSGMLRPDWVIPFKIDKQGAKTALKEFLRGKRLLPSLFQSQNRIDSIAGIYVPYWLFNCQSDASMRFNAQRSTTWDEGKYICTRTDYFLLLREGDMTFERIPVDGSTKIDNRYTEAVEPFDYSAAVDFQTAYLAGYLADKYDVTAEDCAPRANERIRESTEATFRSTAIGYGICTSAGSRIALTAGQVRYALLPLWVLNTKYQGKTYTFAMNGQTGKFVGELPMDLRKFWLWFAGVFAGAAAVLSAIAFLLF